VWGPARNRYWHLRRNKQKGEERRPRDWDFLFLRDREEELKKSQVGSTRGNLATVRTLHGTGKDLAKN